MRYLKVITLYLLFVGAQFVQARGIVLTMQSTSDGKVGTVQMQIDKTHVRVDSTDSRFGERVASILDVSTDTVSMVNYDKKTYTQIKKAQFEQVAASMASMLKNGGDSVLQNLPPERRALIERVMAPGQLQYRQTGTDKAGSWSCTKYEGYRAAEKLSVICVTDPGVLGFVATDFDNAQKLSDMLKVFSPLAADQMSVFGTAEKHGYSGVSVRRTDYVNGKAIGTMELKEIRREALPASTFEIPAGFMEVKLPG